MDDPAALADPFPVPTARRPLDATVRVPGSKSITNRALVCAALAAGTSALEGILLADDTEAMLDGLAELGVGLALDRAAPRVEVTGTRNGRDLTGGLVDARLSGTTSRFLVPVAALADATTVVDGAAPLRGRPMADLFDALDRLGAHLEPLGAPGHLPVRVDGRGLAGGTVDVRGDVSSQFLSALLLAAPAMDDGLRVEVITELVSTPYVHLTVGVMEAFGARVHLDGERRIEVEPGGYRTPGTFDVEPDASAASYPLAAAAVVGGRVRVDGLGSGSAQGDLGFLDALEAMGATVERTPGWVEVRGGGELRGIDIDLRDSSDTAQTLAVVAPFATSPTTIRGIGFIRAKETDRIGAVVAELRRCGIDAEELPDGLRIHPGVPRAAAVRTYDDHRMAMSFALLGLVTPGLTVADPGCVAKTFPGYWELLGAVSGSGVPTLAAQERIGGASVRDEPADDGPTDPAEAAGEESGEDEHR